MRMLTPMPALYEITTTIIQINFDPTDRTNSKWQTEPPHEEG